VAQIFLITYGSYGDVNPFIGLGLALKQRGHVPHLITNEFYKEDVAAAGIEFTANGDRHRFLEITSHPDSLRPYKAVKLLLPYIIESVQKSYFCVEQQRVGKSVTVEHIGLSAGLLARDKLGIPSVLVALSPMNVFSIHSPPKAQGPDIFRCTGLLGRKIIHDLLRRAVDRVCNPPINLVRQQLGMSRIQSFTRWRYETPDGFICAWPKWLYRRQADWPKKAVATGFLEYDGAKDEALCRDKTPTYDRPIVFTAGSATSPAAVSTHCETRGARNLREFFAVSAQVCAMLKRPGILITRKHELLPPKLPEAVIHLAYAPSLRELLSRSCAVVHHGGIATAAHALAAGVPQLLTPVIYDQFDNAARLKNLGVADYLTKTQYNATMVSRKLHWLLESPSVAAKCKYLSQQVDSPAAYERACTVVELALQRAHINGIALDGR
jgi:rhamnosyltransferase subunit B